MNTSPLTVPAQVLTDLTVAMQAAATVVGELWRCSESELVGLLEGTHRVLAQAHAVHLALVAEMTERKIPETVAALDTRNYLRAKLTLTPGEAGQQAKMAAALAGPARDTGTALAEGRICYEQATAIVKTLGALPEQATAVDRDWAQTFLLSEAAELNARDLRRLSRSLNDAIDPDGIEPRDDRARRNRGAYFTDNHDGSQTLKWTDCDETMALAKAAIEALSAPLPAEDGTADPRCASQRRADALAELCARALRAGDLPAARGVRPHLHVTLTAETLRGEDGAPMAATSTGETLSPETVRRLACDADLTAIITNGYGVPLFVGRTHRTVTPGKWAALIARDGGCVFPQCTRPAAWCSAHHGEHWIDGGLTDLDNLYLLCSAHHVTVHHHTWTIRMGPDGHPELIPPPWLDANQNPRRNHHWRTQREMLNRLHIPDPPPP